jgi:hypothetical protein
MPDPVDEADEAIRILTENAVRAAKGGARLAPRGACYNCEEEFRGTDREQRLFCDAACRDDYERREKAKRINPTMSG